MKKHSTRRRSKTLHRSKQSRRHTRKYKGGRGGMGGAEVGRAYTTGATQVLKQMSSF